MPHVPDTQDTCTIAADSSCRRRGRLAPAQHVAHPPGERVQRSAARIAFLYIVLAIVAIGANIGAQDLFVRLYDGALVGLLSVMFGTAVGLLVKYVLDKRFIFDFRARSASHDVRVFLQYTAMGLVTTLIFWAFEFGFAYVFTGKEMRYLGGVIGLGLGYYLKYRLDKRYVFRNATSSRSTEIANQRS